MKAADSTFVKLRVLQPQKYSVGLLVSVLFVWVLHFQDLVKLIVYSSYLDTVMVSLRIDIASDVTEFFLWQCYFHIYDNG